MLKHRVIAAIFLIPMVLLVLFLLPLSYFVFVGITIVALAAWEWSQFVPIVTRPLRVCYAACFTAIATILAIALFSWTNHGMSNFSHLNLVFNILCLSAFWWCLALVLVVLYPKNAIYGQHSPLFKTLAGCFTILPFFVALITLRQQLYFDDQFVGSWTILYVFLLVWMTDTGAYFIGRFFGKHKLAPHVSPGKTWEGLFGGIIVAALGGFIILRWFELPYDSISLLVASIITILVSVLGDLVESMLKREAKIKDSGTLIPGHGGILDRLDSLFAALPIFSLCVLYWLKVL